MTKEEFIYLNIAKDDLVECTFKFKGRICKTGLVSYSGMHDKGMILKENNWSNDFYDIYFDKIIHLKITAPANRDK